MRQEWPQAAFVTGIMALTLAPFSCGCPWRSVRNPDRGGALRIRSLFLGEIRDYYERFWWWDATLHTISGLLLGILGFMFVYILNEDRHVDLHMRASFVALFAFFFAVGLARSGRYSSSGWTNSRDEHAAGNARRSVRAHRTIHDLIVDSVGAAIVAVAGWRYFAHARASRVDDWAKRFIARNPRIFGD
jgi:hypothetical protein